MSRKHVVKVHQIVTDGDMSGTITSDIVNVINLDKASIQIQWTSASIDGELFVDARHKDPLKESLDSGWQALDFNTTLDVDTDNSNHRVVLNELPFTDIRFRFVPTSGTGTLNAFITLKTVGA